MQLVWPKAEPSDAQNLELASQAASPFVDSARDRDDHGLICLALIRVKRGKTVSMKLLLRHHASE